MSSDYLQSIYAQMGEQLDPDETYFHRDSRFAALEEVLRALPPGRFLDIGCGRGLLLRRLADYHDCCGCDFDAGAVAACRQAGLDVRRIDLSATDDVDGLDGKMFDVIVISEVCEHLLNPRAALRFAKRHLSPNGAFIVTVPNAVPLLVRLPTLFGRTVDWLHFPSQTTEATGHIRFYTIRSMSELLEEEGYSVSSVRGVSFRMNGFFWERVCYWVPRLAGKRDAKSATEMDGWLGKHFPGLAPGLLFSCRLRE